MVQNAASLFGVQVANYVVPLVLIPYLTRALGATGWGLVAFSQSFAGYLLVVVEFGFVFSANRDVARHRDDPTKLGDIVTGVLGAKVLLTAACTAASLPLLWMIPNFRDHPRLFWSGVFWGVSQGFSMMWLFQGLERMAVAASIEVSGRILAMVAIVLLVRKPEDAWLVLALQGTAYTVAAALEMTIGYRLVPARWVTWRNTSAALLAGRSMFVYRAALTLYTTGNAFLLGLFVAPQLVGYYSAAEKVTRASLGLLTPITSTLYPRMSFLVGRARDKAIRLARIGAVAMTSAGAGLALFIFLLAPWIVRVLMGPAFGPSVNLLRILSLMPLLVALSHAYGTQWMLPLGLDRHFNTIILLGGALNIVFALVMIPHYAATGMAWSAICAEAVVALGLYVVIRSRGLHLFGSVSGLPDRTPPPS